MTVRMRGGDSKNITFADGFGVDTSLKVLIMAIRNNVVQLDKFYGLAYCPIVRQDSRAIRAITVVAG